MKGGQFRYRGKELSLLFIALVCATVVLWTWERNPLMVTVPQPNDMIQVLSDGKMEGKPVAEVVKDVSSGSSSSLEEEEGKSSQSLGEVKDVPLESSTVLEAAEGKHSQTVEEVKDATLESLASLKEENKGEEKHGQILGEQTSNSVEEISEEAPATRNAYSNVSMTREEQANKEACNYAKGKWVLDDKLPLYSGFGCKQWLSSMWACRMMQRQDFTYEKLRWQPKNCQMEDFEPSKFLERMKDKTVAIIGDSLGRQQFQSLMCMLTGGEERLDVINVGHEYGLVKAKHAVRPDGWAYRFPSTNTTVLYYWSACLCNLEPINITNPVTNYAMHLDQPPSFLRRYLPGIDVLVLNTGHHWNRGKISGNRWVMYVGGKPNTDRKLAMVAEAKKFTMRSIVRWVNSQLPKHPHLKAFYRSISPRHFVNGDWNTGGSCDNATPTSIGKELLQDESSDEDAASAVKGTGVKLLDITALSQLRDEGHISKYSLKAAPGMQDCLHWCLPGVPDTWNELLFGHLSSMSAAQSV